MQLVKKNSRRWKTVRHQFLEAQTGLCAICLKQIETKPNLDHCHKTGMIRGVLCTSCNVMLGWYEANQAQIQTYLAQAAKYALSPARPRMPRGSTEEQAEWRRCVDMTRDGTKESIAL
jgi:hypothetical protein